MGEEEGEKRPQQPTLNQTSSVVNETDTTPLLSDPLNQPSSSEWAASLINASFTSESSATGDSGFIDDTWSIADHSEAGDSALGDELADSTTSLRTSLFEGVSENGRRYHKYKEGKYVLPSDDKELDRLDLQHQLFLMTTNYRLALAPVGRNPAHVLDIGTGTGIWAIDFAQEHPESQVIGVDLSPTQPEFVPDNCHFEIDDVEEPWTWSQKFDFIHARQMTSSFADVPKFFRQCFQNTAPGGWLEMQDTNLPLKCQDDTFPPSSALHQWTSKIVAGLSIFGRELATGKYKQYMEEAGYVDVQEVQYAWPQNTWPKDPHLKELGRWNLVNSLDGLEGYSMALFTRAHGWSVEQLQVFLADVRKDMKNRRLHVYWPMLFVYGRKPYNVA